MRSLEAKSETRSPLLLNVAALKLRVTLAEFERLCELNPDLRLVAEYRDNGVRLGWLINPQDKQVEIYRLGKDIELLEAPATLNGEDVLPGFVLNLKSIL
jgi:hypothetical protein